MVSGDVVFGRIAKPPVVVRHLTPDRKPRGWSRLGPRRIVGTVVHRMEGTLRGSEQHFLSDDPHGRDALADYGIGGALDGDLDGVTWEWIAEDDDRSPWASGPSDGLEGDGPGFVQAYGVAAINRDLRSIELSGKGETPVTPKQFEALCQLIAYVHDRSEIPWDSFPRHPVSGVVTQLQHWEIARKECPGRVVRELTDTYQERVRGILRAAQGESEDEGRKTQEEPTSDSSSSDFRLSPTELTWLFGATTRTLADGSLERWRPADPPRRFAFDPRGVISNAWLQRARRDGVYPRIIDWRQFPTETGETRDVVLFANGWTLRRCSAGGPWVWSDEGRLAA
ncbi:MAG TPA: N-acetylmuramoyl-L-alanine amidase [Thermomicrobiales bacterium]|nr:N-acetylmuramoyl-L-alanine amidase [Thermomicrobiales bacterium]